MHLRRGVRVSAHDERLFRRAADLAVLGEHNRVRVGSILTKGHRQISSGYNRTRNAADNVPYGFATWHAERQTIDKVPAGNYTLYVARLGLEGQWLPSFPCQDCMIEIVACDCVSKICYFDNDSILKVRI